MKTPIKLNEWSKFIRIKINWFFKNAKGTGFYLSRLFLHGRGEPLLFEWRWFHQSSNRWIHRHWFANIDCFSPIDCLFSFPSITGIAAPVVQGKARKTSATVYAEKICSVSKSISMKFRQRGVVFLLFLGNVVLQYNIHRIST